MGHKWNSLGWARPYVPPGQELAIWLASQSPISTSIAQSSTSPFINAFLRELPGAVLTPLPASPRAASDSKNPATAGTRTEGRYIPRCREESVWLLTRSLKKRAPQPTASLPWGPKSGLFLSPGTTKLTPQRSLRGPEDHAARTSKQQPLQHHYQLAHFQLLTTFSPSCVKAAPAASPPAPPSFPTLAPPVPPPPRVAGPALSDFWAPSSLAPADPGSATGPNRWPKCALL